MTVERRPNDFRVGYKALNLVRILLDMYFKTGIEQHVRKFQSQEPTQLRDEA